MKILGKRAKSSWITSWVLGQIGFSKVSVRRAGCLVIRKSKLEGELGKHKHFTGLKKKLDGLDGPGDVGEGKTQEGGAKWWRVSQSKQGSLHLMK